ncbi:inositol monophosphatase [Plakobranchus ocellatus]|uniref:Inositol-1-monophosphatase n=1 Tax=Plakobranchus ocellatus TaxID=259542 RepID=A0AAV3ZLS9_9GAST|nr:inositol monophosphatase [Plakobranchus ocellatus]
MTEQELDEMFSTAIEVAKEAGKVIRDGFYKEKTVDTKISAADLVTETDQAIEKMVHAMITKKFPDHRFIGEESTAESGEKHQLTDDPTWIIDPIDGTTNFVNHVQEVSFSLGVMVNKKTVIGVVYAPIKEEMFSARLGKGAYLNSEKLKASDITDLKEAVIIFEGGNSRDAKLLEEKVKNIHALIAHSRGIRAYGSAAVNLCHVAAGRGQGYVEYGLHIWDFIAGALIATEAGAVVLDPTGSDLDPLRQRVLCACSPEVAKALSQILTHIDTGYD